MRGWIVVLTIGLPLVCLACERGSDQDLSNEPKTTASSELTEPAPRDPGSSLRCQDLRTAVAAEGARAIELRPPSADKQLVVSKTGVVVSFSREDCLTVARCLNLQQAVNYIEQQTGSAPESPLPDAFQLSYVAAALLDVGRASVRLRDETTSRKSIVRDHWSAEGCAGRCRSVGRIYRLSESDPSFFLRITDKTENLRD